MIAIIIGVHLIENPSLMHATTTGTEVKCEEGKQSVHLLFRILIHLVMDFNNRDEFYSSLQYKSHN